jgi:RNA polymerase sigma factor FliA
MTERDEAILGLEELVVQIARRLASRLRRLQDLDDYVQFGMVGLIQAVDNYDASVGSLPSYACSRIRGAILDGVRRESWRPRSVVKFRRRRDAIERDLTATLGRAPEPGELAAALEVSVGQLAELDARNAVCMVPISVELDGEETTTEALDPRPNPEQLCIDALGGPEALRAEFAARLRPRHARVMELYFIDDWTQASIAREVGVNNSRVSQIIKTALETLRAA